MHKVFYENTIDGMICNIISNILFENIESEIYSNSKLLNMIIKKEHKKYKSIYILGPIKWEIANIITLSTDNVRLFDIHDYATWLNKYNWATVIALEPQKGNMSLAKLFFEEISKEKSIIKNKNLKLIKDLIDFTNKYYISNDKIYCNFKEALNNIGIEQLSNDILKDIKTEKIKTIQDIFNIKKIGGNI